MYVYIYIYTYMHACIHTYIHTYIKEASGAARVFIFDHTIRESGKTNLNAKAGGSADQMLDHDIFTLSGVKQVAKIPRNADGGIDWYYKGPKSDPEFMNCLNRHSSFTTMLAAWQATGNPAYPTYFSTLVEDWVCRFYAKKKAALPGGKTA